MGFDSAVSSLDVLQIEYEVARTMRQILLRRLTAATTLMLLLVAWLHTLPWIAFIVTALLAAGLSGIAVRNEQQARQRCRSAARDLARVMKVLPQTGTQPRAR